MEEFFSHAETLIVRLGVFVLLVVKFAKYVIGEIKH